MGAVNYKTSGIITLGIEPYDRYDLEHDDEFMRVVRAEVDEYGGTESEHILSWMVHRLQQLQANGRSH